MPESIDWPPSLPGRPRRRRRFFLILAVLAVIFLFLGGRAALSYYVDVIWFRSLGYGDVFFKALRLQTRPGEARKTGQSQAPDMRTTRRKYRAWAKSFQPTFPMIVAGHFSRLAGIYLRVERLCFQTLRC
jgi:hypothetical protein